MSTELSEHEFCEGCGDCIICEADHECSICWNCRWKCHHRSDLERIYLRIRTEIAILDPAALTEQHLRKIFMEMQ